MVGLAHAAERGLKDHKPPAIVRHRGKPLGDSQRHVKRLALATLEQLPAVCHHVNHVNRQRTSRGRASIFYTWFKLGKIERADESELNKLIYATAPHDDIVPGAQSLQGRRIASIRELLQFGNVTYWIAGPAPSHIQSAQELIFPKRHLRAIAPHDPVFAKWPSILHISDPHLDRGHHAYAVGHGDSQTPSLATVISQSLARVETEPGLVVVTGDLTWTGTDDQFGFARDFLEDLRGQLGLTRDHFVIIPGNHDINWTSTDPKTDYDWSAPAAVAEADAKRSYREFFGQWYKTPANEWLSVGRRFFLRGGPTLDVLGLNTSELKQTKDNFAGLGRVTEQAFEESAKAMGWREQLREAEFRILALHHHVLPVVAQEEVTETKRGFGISIDAARQIQRAGSYAVDLILHGHQHQPYFGCVRSEPTHGSHGILVLGAGSSGVIDSHLGPIRQRHFNLIRIGREGVRIESFLQPNAKDVFERSVSYTGRGGTGWVRSDE